MEFLFGFVEIGKTGSNQEKRRVSFLRVQFHVGTLHWIMRIFTLVLFICTSVLLLYNFTVSLFEFIYLGCFTVHSTLTHHHIINVMSWLHSSAHQFITTNFFSSLLPNLCSLFVPLCGGPQRLALLFSIYNPGTTCDLHSPETRKLSYSIFSKSI